jgi:hypothetical protein
MGTGRMPSIFTEPHMIAVIGLGLIGAALTVAGVYLMAVRWRKRTGFPYCLSAFVFYALVFIATFQHGLLNADISPEVAASWLLTVLIVGQALVTCVGVAIFSLLVFGAHLTFLGELEYPLRRTKAYAGCALFCFVFSLFLNPINAAREVDTFSTRSIYKRALANASPEFVEAASQEARRTLDALRQIGAVARIDATKTALVHHVKGQFIDLPRAVVEDYMQAALLYHVHFESGAIKQVVLREVGTDREIARLEPNGVFHRGAARHVPPGEEPPGG